MNKQRRIIIKVAVATGVVAASYPFIFAKQQTAKEAFDLTLSSLSIPHALSELSSKHPDAEQQILNRFAKSFKTENDFLTEIKATIADDYQKQKWLQVHQWLLSETECLLAAAYVQIIGTTAVSKTAKSFENAPNEKFLKVLKWGPQETYQGVKFNEQPDGHCGIWANIESMPDGMRVFIGGKERHIFPNEKGFTSGIYDEVEAFINSVGQSEIVVYDEINHRKQTIGAFTVLPPFKFYQHPDGHLSRVFGPVDKWGPNKVQLGEVFNEQPNGHAAFWIKINSMSNQVQLIFNNETFRATVRKGLITASLSPQYLPKEIGNYSLQLKDVETNEQILVGELQVLPQK